MVEVCVVGTLQAKRLGAVDELSRFFDLVRSSEAIYPELLRFERGSATAEVLGNLEEELLQFDNVVLDDFAHSICMDIIEVVRMTINRNDASGKALPVRICPAEPIGNIGVWKYFREELFDSPVGSQAWKSVRDVSDSKDLYSKLSKATVVLGGCEEY